MGNEILPLGEAICYYFKGINCSVCTVLEPKVSELIKTSFPKIKYNVVEPESDTALAAKMNVFSAPTIIVLFEGKEILRKGRNLSIPEFEKELRRFYDLFFS